MNSISKQQNGFAVFIRLVY